MDKKISRKIYFRTIKLMIPKIAPILILMGVLLLLFGFKDELFSFNLEKEKSPYALMGILYVIIGIAFMLYRYIETGPNSNSKFSNKYSYEHRILRQINQIKNELSDKYLENQNKELDIKKIDSLIQDKINFNIENSLRENIEKKYGDNALKLRQNKILDNQTDELQIGVNTQIGKLSRSGTINLIIGLLTTLIAIWVLTTLILSVNEINFETTKDFLVYLIPRLSLAIFIELFSFFFLRLYKRNLEDIKYFHNERTNIDSKIIALKSALLLDKEELLVDIIKSFAAVERNFIIKKDESTIHLEKIKIDSQQELNYFSKISDIIEKIKK